ncbi:hypothetical protein PGT21_011254 [Puccinia graminis f. sp. tritici]|uniref:Uncharacterized protein n=1 Tax=Puccinia graminis f. sp. tritici TaxID=56615 RepID=A0A5B0QAB8_PUCGR|nr:hypothetical protein PGTUg99_005186 [Puccinia graminis f. sp. tritici]KAA1110117.1 hypothetical protein PGT21_011254 [Puccinia graminis f. sp. tritici]
MVSWFIILLLGYNLASKLPQTLDLSLDPMHTAEVAGTSNSFQHSINPTIYKD